MKIKHDHDCVVVSQDYIDQCISDGKMPKFCCKEEDDRAYSMGYGQGCYKCGGRSYYIGTFLDDGCYISGLTQTSCDDCIPERKLKPNCTKCNFMATKEVNGVALCRYHYSRSFKDELD